MATSLGSARRPLFSLAASAQLVLSQTLMSPEPVPETRKCPSVVKVKQLTELEKHDNLRSYLKWN